LVSRPAGASFLKRTRRFRRGRIHERLEVQGPIHALSGEIEHHSFKDSQDHLARCQKYARLWAEEKFELGKKAGVLDPALHALFRWIRGYLLRGGFLDGAQGLRIANFCAYEVFLKYRLLRKCAALRVKRQFSGTVFRKAAARCIYAAPTRRLENYPE